MVHEENPFYKASVSLSIEYITGGRERIKKHLDANKDEDILALVEVKCAELAEKSKEIFPQRRDVLRRFPYLYAEKTLCRHKG